jgi:hypothetical protein
VGRPGRARHVRFFQPHQRKHKPEHIFFYNAQLHVSRTQTSTTAISRNGTTCTMTVAKHKNTVFFTTSTVVRPRNHKPRRIHRMGQAASVLGNNRNPQCLSGLPSSASGMCVWVLDMYIYIIFLLFSQTRYWECYRPSPVYVRLTSKRYPRSVPGWVKRLSRWRPRNAQSSIIRAQR